ncbi:MAG: TolC family protein [Gemmatimonadota bacterium]
MLAFAGIVTVAVAGCVHSPPQHLAGGASLPESPGRAWPRAPALAPPGVLSTDLPPDSTIRFDALGVTDVVELALAHNPETAASWRQARAAAAAYGSAGGTRYPTVTGTVSGGPSKVISTAPGRLPASRVTFGPQVTLTQLLFDFGGRSGAIEAAREALLAADLTHNATLQNVALQAEVGYFNYQAARGLLAAQQATVGTARANLAAAEQRHNVGLATIADVLQAETAVAQAELTLQNAEAEVQSARANLAFQLGIAPNARFDAVVDTAAVPIGDVAESVDSLIARAVAERPDLAAAEAEARQAAATARSVRSGIWPSLGLTATAGRVYADTSVLGGSNYSLSFGLTIPLFSGLSRQYDAVAARELAAAARARSDLVRLQVAAQVFSSYHGLRTATQRVATATRLLASAERSEEVAQGRYREGVGSILDVLAAQAALADARAQRVQARWGWFASLAQLAHDAGVLGPRGEAPIRLSPDSTKAR